MKELKKEYEDKIQKAEESLKAANEKIAGHDQIVADLTTRATTAEGKLLKNRIANESGVPYELADRLVGSNEEELKADAEKFASFLAPKSAPPLHSSDAPTNTNAGLAGMLSQINSQFSS